MRKLFVLLAAVWLVLNLITLTGYPAVWVDETLFSDPSVHLALGKGFVSSVWYNQPSWDFWAGYTPLYSFALAGWLKAFGISEITVRSFGLLLSTASLFMLWLLLKRVGDDSLRLTIILAVAVCEPVAFLERAGRQDSICLFLLAATALVFAEKTWRWRSALLWMLGALSLPAALQYTAYILVLGALVHFWFKPFSKRDLLLWVTGAASGSLVLAAIYSAHHVLKMFIEVTFLSQHSSIGRLLQRIVLGHGPEPFSFSYISTAWVRDFATPVLILGSSVAWFLARRQNDRSASQWSSFALACSVLIPLAIQLLGQYPIYYTYMGAVPATVAVLVAAKQLKGSARLLTPAILVLLLAGGTGRFWWKGFSQGAEPFYDPDHWVSQQDIVVADYPIFYAVRARALEIFAPDYAGGKLLRHYPANQAASVTKLLVRDSRFEEVAAKVGGHWRRIGNVQVIRHGTPTELVTIDDDTRHPVREKIGVYVRDTAKP